MPARPVLASGGAVALVPVLPLTLNAHNRDTGTIAAEPGWRNLAIWALPPVAYALASDTLIGVVRAWALAPASTLAGSPRLGAGRVPVRPRPPARSSVERRPRTTVRLSRRTWF